MVWKFDDDGLYFPAVEYLYEYLFGIEDYDTYAIVDLYDEKVILVVQTFDPLKDYWRYIKSPEEFKRQY